MVHFGGVAVLLALNPITAASLPTVAVMPIQSKTLAPAKTAALDNVLVSVVAEAKTLNVLGAGDVNAMLGLEKMKEAVGCSDLSCAAELGGALGAAYLLTTTADALGSKTVITMTFIDLKAPRVVARKHVRVEANEDAYLDALEKLVGELLEAVRPEVTTQTTLVSETQTTGPQGSIRVTSDEPGEVVLDGVSTGKMAPTILSGVGLGAHTVAVMATSRRGSLAVEVRAGETVDARVPLGTMAVILLPVAV